MPLPLLPILLIGGAAVAAIAMASGGGGGGGGGLSSVPPPPGWKKRTGQVVDSGGLTQEWETTYFSEADERARMAVMVEQGQLEYTEFDPSNLGWSYRVWNVNGAGYPTVQYLLYGKFKTEQAAIDEISRDFTGFLEA